VRAGRWICDEGVYRLALVRREGRDVDERRNFGMVANGLVRLRRGNEARWVDPLAESARYEQLLAEGFTA